MTEPLVDAHLVVERPAFRLDLPLRVDDGEVVALLGPNGAGKTTALRALAGLQPLTSGHIRLGDRDLDTPDDRAWTPPERRPIGVVFQDYLLFPHLTALDNVAFGPRRHGVDRGRARRQAARWLADMDLAEHAHRKPRELSGGQAQRVALARALAVEPALLLLDEPLAALDARTRFETRNLLHHHLTRHTGATLLVTHDPLDALILADRLVIVEDGRVVQEGDATTITTAPRTDYVAHLVGLNLYRGQADGRTIHIGPDVTLPVPEPLDGDAFVAFPPAAVTLLPKPPEDGSPTTWSATITGIQRHGDNLRIRLDGPIATTADITPATAAVLHPEPGQQVWARLDETKIRGYPAR